MALSVIHLGIAKRLTTTPLDDLQGLSQLLIRGVFAIEEVEKIARAKVESNRFVDEIEVHLGYLIHLREALSLPLDVQEMLYFRCGKLSENDLKNARDIIAPKVNDYDEQCKLLAKNDFWRRALEKRDPKAYEEATSGYTIEQDLIALTKKYHPVT